MKSQQKSSILNVPLLSEVAEYSLGCTAAELLEFLVTVSLQATATAGRLYLAYWKRLV
jgi:hypothetical protein